MELDRSLYKAEHLLKQQRYNEAHQEVHAYLASDPESIPALFILVQTYLGLNQDEKANEIADQLVKRDPSDPDILFLKAVTLMQLGQRKSALKFLDSVLAYDPLRAEAHGLKASIYFSEAEFEKSLEAANTGLTLDAHNELCLNHRSMSLLRLDRREEHLNADLQSLKSNPMNPMTHAAVGYSALQKGEYDKAKDHFRESLRLDPGNELGRQGMLQTIKATNLYYRLFLKYAFWMQGLKPQVRWMVVIVGYILIQVLDRYKSGLGALAPVAGIIVVLYMIFAISTWIIGPVSNIFLRFHPFGKFVLTEEEKKVANICAALLSVALIGAVLLFALEHQQLQWKNLGVYLVASGIALTVVVSSIESRSLEKSKRNLRRVGTIFAVACGVLVLSAFVAPALAYSLFNLLVYAFIGYQFYANSQE